MKHFRIRYCQPDSKSGFREVTPDIATVFRVFQGDKHAGDFYPMSAALAFIETHKEVILWSCADHISPALFSPALLRAELSHRWRPPLLAQGRGDPVISGGAQ